MFLVSSQLVMFTLIGVVFHLVRNLVAEAGEHEGIKIWDLNLHS